MSADYQRTVEALFSRHASVQYSGFSAAAYKPGLEAMRVYASRLGDPQEGLRIIHVAGTNGKGSVCSMLASALAACGLRVGLYTSPHLLDFRERMKIVEGEGFRMIPREYVCSFVERHDSPSLSFFEITTGMALRWFADSDVDIVVLETGLGGRLDSTNIVTPALSVITSIGLDHCALLGGTLADIASEKAGIFKKGVPALVWGHCPDTDPVFMDAAAAVGCPLHFASDIPVPCAVTDISGPCTGTNLHTALAALQLLNPEEYPALTAALLRGLGNAAERSGLRGRWEQLRSRPLVICDIGHNPQALSASFERLRGSGRKLHIVFGMMADKDTDSVAALLPEEACCYLVTPATPRAMKAEELALKLKNQDVAVFPGVAPGVRAALEEAGREPDNALVFIGGSTYVVSEAISYIQGT